MTRSGREPYRVVWYRHYVLGVLFVAYMASFIDRQILAVLLDDVKQELGVSDASMGFLTGFAFAVFYTFAGLPVARWADRGVRRSVIALGLAVWSAMTALSGLAASFAQLALARVGVGVGEAALSPPAHALLADYYPRRQRATALSVYSTAIFTGVLVGYPLIGALAARHGWRAAFLALGLPGLALAALVRLSVREPARGATEPAPRDADVEPVAAVLRFLWTCRSFRHLALGAAIASLAGYGFFNWAPTFFRRLHGLSAAETGAWLGAIIGLGGVAGTLGGGLVSDRLGARDPRWYLRLPAAALGLSLPCAWAAVLAPGRAAALGFYLPYQVLAVTYLGPAFALTQSLVRLRMRATAAAVLLFLVNLIGLGLGPWAVGVVSALLAGPFGPASLRYALLAVSLAYLWAALHFLLAARTLEADMRPAPPEDPSSGAHRPGDAPLTA